MPTTSPPQTLAQKLVARAAGRAHVTPGEIVTCRVDLTVSRGEIVAVLGHNGAGKTTTLNAIFGFIEPMSGTVSLAGSEVTALPPVEHARRGMTFVPAERSVFQDLSVEDNLLLAAMQEPSAERREEH